ncbi:MAG: rhodanese-like domain-containing protein [Dehalococcoidia bacterium]|nr:MAG: rhodanese-like domain-containing protein [Dehalococcoidia bacterium]
MLRKLVLVLLSSVIAGSLAGCATLGTSNDQIISTITVVEAFTMIQENQGELDFVILDVRTPSEFAAGHIEGALIIDFNGNFKAEIEKLDKAKRYLVYCRTSNRSGDAVYIMRDLGFQEVYDMDGGIVAWEAEGYPLVK